MKKRTITAASAFLLLTFATAHLKAQDTLQITLEDALRIALSDNPTVKVADKEIEKRKYAQKGVYAHLFPQVNFDANYNRTIKKQVMYMDFDMPGLGGGMGEAEAGDDEASAFDMSKGIEIGRSNNWSAGFNAGMPLVNATLWKSLSISATDVELAIEQARSSKIAMVNEVKNSFYTVLLAKDSYNVFKASYDNAVENYLDIKKKYDQGLVAEYDLIRANVRVNNVEPNLLEAENSVKLAAWQLKALLGMDLDIDIDCYGSLTDFRSQLYNDYMTTDTSLANNSELAQIDLQTKLLGQTLKLNKLEYTPTLSAMILYQWNVMDNTFKFSQYRWNPYSMVGLSLSVPIFSGFGKYNKIKETTVSLAQIELQRDNVERTLKLAIRQSMDKMTTGIKKFGASKRSVEEAERGHLIAQKRYDTGSGTLLELNDAELALTQARLNYNQAIYEYVVAKSNLEKILGQQQ